jgi:hypothetical protein
MALPARQARLESPHADASKVDQALRPYSQALSAENQRREVGLTSFSYSLQNNSLLLTRLEPGASL